MDIKLFSSHLILILQMRNALIYNIVGDLKGKLTRNDVIIITTKIKIFMII
jgi:hypothetical protein